MTGDSEIHMQSLHLDTNLMQLFEYSKNRNAVSLRGAVAAPSAEYIEVCHLSLYVRDSDAAPEVLENRNAVP